MRSVEGSIYRHDDGRRWFARLQYTDAAGRRREKKRICRTHELAKRKLGELRGEIADAGSGRKTYRELDSYYRKTFVHKARFVGGKKLSGFRQDLASVEHYLDRALEQFGDKYLDEITYSDLREYKQTIADRETMYGRERSISDINHHLKWVRQVFTIAVENAWVKVSPFKLGRPLIIESHEVERTRVLSAVEETKLLTACDRWRGHIKPIIIFAIETALRAGEIKSLRWADVTLDGRCIKIRSLNSKTLKSRLVPLSGRAADVLAQQRQNSGRRVLVFGDAAFKKAFHNACIDADLTDVHFHDLRHTAITRWLKKGMSIADAMKASGHSQMKTFMRYVNQSEESIFDQAKLLDRAA
jgi:integrase